MVTGSWSDGGDVFDRVAALYAEQRPGFPSEVFEDIASITGLAAGSRVLEIGPGTGQATVGLVEMGASVIGLERGPSLAAAAARRFEAYAGVEFVTTRFEDWNPRSTSFDAVVAANCWHWLNPETRWRHAHVLLGPDGWLILLSHIVVREPGEREVYAETADLHERYASGHPSWGPPPAADDVVTAAEGASATIEDVERVVGRASDISASGRFGPPILRWYRQTQWLDARGFVDLLRTTSLYGNLPVSVREPLLEGIETRIRSRLGDRARRDYLVNLRLARRIDE